MKVKGQNEGGDAENDGPMKSVTTANVMQKTKYPRAKHRRGLKNNRLSWVASIEDRQWRNRAFGALLPSSARTEGLGYYGHEIAAIIAKEFDLPGVPPATTVYDWILHRTSWAYQIDLGKLKEGELLEQYNQANDIICQILSHHRQGWEFRNPTVAPRRGSATAID